jgi:hypothetical protein
VLGTEHDHHLATEARVVVARDVHRVAIVMRSSSELRLPWSCMLCGPSAA